MNQIASPGKIYNVDSIRADFPILGERPYGNPLAYLDNAASAQKPRQVLERLDHFYKHEYANVHRGLHFLANESTEAFEGARETVRRFLNAVSVDEIIFTRGATESLNLVAASFGLAHIAEGDEIILSMMEHHSNIVPWHFLRERKGAVIKWIEVDENGYIDLDSYEKLFTPRTKIVALTHMSNVLAAPVPVQAAARIAHANGVPIVVDGSQGAVHLDVDVRELDVDFYVVTGHKLYGPTGIGVLYGKRKWLESLPPYAGGGEMIETVTLDNVTYNTPPHRFEAGTPPIAQAVGLAAALDYMDRVGRNAIHAYEAGLTAYAMARLSEIEGLRIYGHAPDKGPIIAFDIDGLHAHDIATIIDRSGVAVRAGTHCAMPLLARFGVTSTCRASFAMYNTREEVDRLVEALHKAKQLFG